MACTITTTYEMNDEGYVTKISWLNDVGFGCDATLVEGTKQYQYSSQFEDDENPVIAPNLLSLADCILQANLHLGLIPPQRIPALEIENQH